AQRADHHRPEARLEAQRADHHRPEARLEAQRADHHRPEARLEAQRADLQVVTVEVTTRTMGWSRKPKQPSPLPPPERRGGRKGGEAAE
ncbi:MAG: hypothetical protein IK119_00745, partial [Bacteroidales bacterium]|nr:hypothetical protein [Bacteroidales bacterium]